MPLSTFIMKPRSSRCLNRTRICALASCICGTVGPSPGGRVAPHPGTPLRSCLDDSVATGSPSPPPGGQSQLSAKGEQRASPQHCLFAFFFFLNHCTLCTRSGYSSSQKPCVRVLVDMRGATAEPSAVKCPSIPPRSCMARGSWAGRWGHGGSLDACWNAKSVEFENEELPAASPEERGLFRPDKADGVGGSFSTLNCKT